MNLEIERKWLVNNLAAIPSSEYRQDIIQGYVIDIHKSVLRVRSVSDGDNHREGYITIKYPVTTKGAVGEIEIEIPYEVSRDFLSTCSKVITKTRYNIPYGRNIIELDVFKGDLQGLIVAEVEFTSVGEDFDPPPWFGKEVTDDKRYSNVQLLKNGLPSIDNT